jgi:hypothetical protein
MINTSELTKLTEEVRVFVACINEVCGSRMLMSFSNQIPLRFRRQIPPHRTIHNICVRPCCEICQ